ncbi:MAG: helix-turn-helix domain-containing protein [Desulfuromonadaceae bacterium]
MRKNDARKMSEDERLERRQQVIRLYNEKMPVMEIVEITGLSWPAVNVAIKKFEAGGMDALLPSKRGRKVGTDRILSVDQELVVRKLLYRSRPNLLKPMIKRRDWNLYLWDREAVAELIRKKCRVPCDCSAALKSARKPSAKLICQKCGIKLSKRCVDNYLERWGIPKIGKHQRPIDRCSELVQRKLKKDKHLERISDEKLQVFWVKTSKPSLPGNPLDKLTKHLSLILATDNRGKEYWLFYKGRYSDDQQIDFLQTLLKQARGRIAVVRDDAKYYTERPVKEWLSDNNSKIEIVPPPTESLR